MQVMFSSLVFIIANFFNTCVEADEGQECKDFVKVTQELWTNDIDRLGPNDVILNYQARLPDKGNIHDKSPQRLFSYVNESRLTSPVFTTFLPLLNNYDPVKNDPEVLTPHKIAEDEAFLDAILSTKTFQTLFEYLLCEGV
ncbi:poly(U)-specific endoribonuclease [Elysia marginata]|uniref:Uridylate-specific endoribonuclease n=1 Tax=Elysia marginata TaxID=1093978 RepID=A0AAV4H5Q4_9GAST|nr:poly(U)-specific endoribonuclease [Elysia marginata]